MIDGPTYACLKSASTRPTSGRCIHETCRPPISEELKRMDTPVLPHYTATLTVQRGDAQVIVRGTVYGPAAFVDQALHALADAFKDEAER